MNKQYHILNGDSLKDQFPEGIEGEKIIARECLVDGNVKGDNLAELYHSRAQFISNTYGGYTKEEYFEETVTEFKKMQDIQGDSEVNLWFEDDLFCQVNLWFVVHLLLESGTDTSLFLVRPEKHTWYGFAGLNESELKTIYRNRIALTQLDSIASLWKSYQNDNTENLMNTAKELANLYPFILPAVEAHIERIPTGENPGRPTRTLISIMNELETNEFGPVFMEFSKREYIYGFGDLQVKKLFDEIKS